MYKLQEIAKVAKGNKTDFEPNLLTKALAKRRAKKDKKTAKKELSKMEQKTILKVPYVV